MSFLDNGEPFHSEVGRTPRLRPIIAWAISFAAICVLSTAFIRSVVFLREPPSPAAGSITFGDPQIDAANQSASFGSAICCPAGDIVTDQNGAWICRAIPKWTGGSVLENSTITDNGSTLTVAGPSSFHDVTITGIFTVNGVVVSAPPQHDGQSQPSVSPGSK
jgi:hypothetical protein